MLWATQEKCNSAILSIFTCTEFVKMSARFACAFKKDVRDDDEATGFCIIAHQWSKQTRLSFFLPLFRNMRASVTNVMCTKNIHANTIADKQRFIKSIRYNVNKWTRGPFGTLDRFVIMSTKNGEDENEYQFQKVFLYFPKSCGH